MLKFQLEKLSPHEQEIHERALSEARDYLASEARLFKTIGAIDESRLYLKLGYTSTFAYCLKALRLSEAVTMNFINVARKAREVPALALAIESGDLRVATARKIVPVLEVSNSQDWITRATQLPQAQLERAVAETTGVHTTERIRPAHGNRTQLQVGLSPEIMQDLKWVQDFVSQKVGHSVTIEETLATALESYRNRHDPVRKAERKLAVNPTRLDRTANLSQTGATASSRPRIASVLHAVNLRDRRECQAVLADGQKCRRSRFLHYHHKIPVAQGGPTTVENLITLCSQCHSRWHGQPQGA